MALVRAFLNDHSRACELLVWVFVSARTPKRRRRAPVVWKGPWPPPPKSDENACLSTAACCVHRSTSSQCSAALQVSPLQGAQAGESSRFQPGRRSLAARNAKPVWLSSRGSSKRWCVKISLYILLLKAATGERILIATQALWELSWFFYRIRPSQSVSGFYFNWLHNFTAQATKFH